MLLASLVFAALVPLTAPPVPEPTPEFHSMEDWRPSPPLRANTSDHVVVKGVQLVGGWGAGLIVGIGGGVAAIPPALVFTVIDSGDVGAGMLVFGAGCGYSIGAAWAISSAGKGLGGCEGSRLMTELGTGAGLALTLAFFRTGMVELSTETVLLGSLVPPLMGILAFELTRAGPCSPKKITPSLPVGGLVTAGLGSLALRHANVDTVEPRRTVFPLLLIRW